MSVAIKVPSVRERAFNCPFCNAFSAQTWFNILADHCGANGEMPAVFERQDLAVLSAMSKPDALRFKRVSAFINRKAILLPASHTIGVSVLGNVYAAQCHHCDDISIWVADKLVHPVSIGVSLPNEDMPDDIKADFEEARSVFVASPRASAALLRLCIQKLCIHLGETTGKIDSDIASMVKKGLNPLVQQSLDIVRVIGNESVHPGSIDLNDDRETAEQLFTIVNIIVMQMISQPKIVNDMYARLPAAKLQGIQQRDKAATKK